MEERKDDNPFDWSLYGSYLLQNDFQYKGVEITSLLRAKVIHCIDPSDPDGNRICIEFSSTELLEVKLSIEEVFKRYETQLFYFKNFEPADGNHLLVIYDIYKLPGTRSGENKLRVIAEGIQDMSLRKKIDNNQEPLGVEEATLIFAQLFNALKQLAGENEKLMQLHPGFIFFDRQGKVKLSPVVPLKEKGPKIRSYVNLDEESGNKEKGLHRMLWNLGVIFFEMLLKTLPWGDSGVHGEGYPQLPEQAVFEDMIKDLSPSYQEILKVLLRFGEHSTVTEDQVKAVEKFIRENCRIYDELNSQKQLALTFEHLEDYTNHKGFACAVCKKKDFSEVRFSTSNQSKCVCSSCFRTLGRDPTHSKELPLECPFVRIDRPYFSLEPKYNKAGSLLAIIKHLTKEKEHMVYNFPCSKCRKNCLMVDLKRFSGNPFLCLCQREKNIEDLADYLNQPDILNGSGEYHYYDLNPNTPLFLSSQYSTKLMFKLLNSGFCYAKKKRSVSKPVPEFLDFIQNLRVGTIIQYPYSNSVSGTKDKIQNQFVNQTYTKLRNLYMGNLLQYYSMEVDNSTVSLLVEPLGDNWKPLTTDLENSQPSKPQELVDLMKLICKCVESLHSLGISHGHLSLNVFLSTGAMYTQSTTLKLFGLELLDFEPYLRPEMLEFSKKYRDPKYAPTLDCDIYSIGCILKELWVQYEKRWKINDVAQTQLSLLFGKCIQKDQMARPSIEDVIEALELVDFS